jgi:hypothetical protein
MIPPEQQRIIEASFAADEARARKQRMETGALEIEFEGAPDDPSVSDSTFQAELDAFSGTLRQSEIPHSQRAIAFDAVDAHGYPLAEFTIQLLNSPAIGVLGTAIGIWLKGRFGRKAHLKFGRDEVKLEGYTPEEIDQVLERAVAYRASLEKAGKAE